jgi:hypothetical protein
MQESYTQQSEA